jgi:hypothetical protein
MKWLVFSLVLTTACGIADPSRKALAFEFAQGVIVDTSRSVVYIMNPEGRIDAVNLFTGEVIATSTRGAKPLLLYDNVLLAQAEAKDQMHVLSVVGLTTKDLKPKFELDLPLPGQTQASIDDRLGGTFYASARIDGNEITLRWRSVQRLVSGVATGEPAHVTTGFARIDSTSGRLITSGEGEPSALGIAMDEILSNAKKPVNSGALASPLCAADNL